MSWSQAISIILGSSVLATILGYLADQWRDQKKSENERREKLYGPLRFYLMLLERNYKLRQELIKSRFEADKRFGHTGINHEELEKKFNSDNNELVESWWVYARKIVELLENNSRFVKEEHWPLIEKLFESYMFRKVVTGEESQKGAHWLYGDDIFEKDTKNEFVATLDELRKKIS